MSTIKTAKSPKIPKSRHSARPDRPGKAKTVSPKSKGYGINRNPSGSHLTPDHVRGNRNPKKGTAKGIDNMANRPLKRANRERNSPSHSEAMENTIPKAKPGKSGTYTQK